MTPRLPTTDIYFTHACHDWVDRWWSKRFVKPLGKNSFVADRTMILIRRDDDDLMRRALEWQGRLVYLVDDDIAGAIDSPDLPPEYRRRLSQFDRDFHQHLLERADILLVPSEPLAALFGRNPRITAEIRQIFPYWPITLADDRHYRGLAVGQVLRIAHLGSGSHAGAFDALAPVLSEILTEHADVHLTYIGRRQHAALPDRHPQIRRVAPKRWPGYRRWLGRQRFHLALYPLDFTRFDRARSPNKLVEHAIVGAVGMYPEDWPVRCLTGGGSLAAPTDPGDWAAALAGALEGRATLAGLAEKAKRSIELRNDRALQRAIWSDVLDLDVA